ncbi:MAG: O-antigen ligase family protein [Planctomycetes bacterium]|nr:O-antigen ligase family protein [Planctomycetota bacterium]
MNREEPVGRSILPILGSLVLAVSPLVTWWGFGYDALRLPLVALGTAMLLAGGIVGRKVGVWPSLPWILAAGAYLGAHGLSAVLARNGGEALPALLPVTAGVAVFWAVARGRVPQAPLVPFIAGMAALFATLGLGQRLGGLPAVSTLGNTNYAGALSAILTCFCVGGVLSEGSRRLRLFCAASALLGAAHVAVSQSRGAMVGLAVGLVAVGLWGLRHGPRWAVAACALPAVLAAALNLPRVRQIVDPRDETARVRFGLWKGTLRLARDHPVAGCGTGNFRFEFPPYRDAEEFEISSRSTPEAFIEAREPHSTPLLVLAETGPVGLAGYVGLVVLGVMGALRSSRLAAPLGGLAAFAAAGLFNSLHQFSPFDVLSGALLGWVAAADARERPGGRASAWMCAAGTIVALIWGWKAVGAAAAERHFWSAMAQARDVERRVLGLQAALRARPDHWQARTELGVVYMHAGDFAGAARELRGALERHPNNVNILTLLAHCAYENKEPPENVERLFREALSLQPNYWRTHYNLGKMAVFEGRYEEAVEWFRGARACGADVGRRLRQTNPELEHDPRFREFFGTGK